MLAKNACLASPYSPVCQHVCAGLPPGVFSWSLIMKILSVKFSFGYSRTNILGTLHGDVSRNTVTMSNALLCCVSVTACAVLRTAICVGQQYVGNTLNFHGNSGNANALQCHVICTLHILLCM